MKTIVFLSALWLFTYSLPTLADTVVLPNGDKIDAEISVAYEQDSYVFFAKSGANVRLRVVRTDDSGLSPRMELFDPNGNRVTADSFGAIAQVVETSGIHRIVIADNTTGHSATGAYSVYFVRVPGANEGRALINGGVRSDYIDIGDLDSYTFFAKSGENVRLRVARTDDSGMTPRMELFDPSGSLVTADSFGAIAQTIEINGFYTVVIADNTTGHRASGAYDVYFARVPGANEGRALKNGGVRSDHIDIGDLDSYTFFANPGESVRLRVARTDDSGMTPRMELFDPNGSRVNTDSSGAIAQSIETGGIYTVVISDNTTGHRATGDYDVYFARAPGANEGGALINGGARSDYIDIGDLDSYTFFAQAGEVVNLRVVRTDSSGLTPRMELFDPSGRHVASYAAGAFTQAIVETEGTYTVVIADNTTGHRATGAYSVEFSTNGDRLSYAALGDSFSSGEGLYPYQNPNDRYLTFPWPLNLLGLDGGCHRSDRAYSHQIKLPGETVPLVEKSDTDFNFFACTGATTDNIRVNGESLHGQPTQLTPNNAIDENRDLITITVGGNDAQFARIAGYCISQRDCVNQQPFAPYTTISLRDLAPFLIRKTGEDLRKVQQQIRDLATNATIVVFGYPILVSGNECPAVMLPGAPIDKLSADEQQFLRQLNADLNTEIAASTSAVGLHYIPVADAFADHEICDTATNWINGIDILNPAASFHPTARGQTEYANAFNAYMESIATGWPNGYSDKGLPRNPTPVLEPTASVQAVATPLPRFGGLGVRPVGVPDECNTAEGVLTPGQEVVISGEGFNPGEAVQISLMSNDQRIALGSAIADTQGTILEAVLIPEDLVPETSGSIQALGAGQNGAGLLLMTSYRVEATAALDSDSDGVPDLCDNCSEIANSAQRDTDSDGYGSMCDADLDNNGIVNMLDLALFKAAYGTSGSDLAADLDGNYVVNILDFLRFVSLYGKAPGPAFGK